MVVCCLHTSLFTETGERETIVESAHGKLKANKISKILLP